MNGGSRLLRRIVLLVIVALIVLDFSGSSIVDTVTAPSEPATPPPRLDTAPIEQPAPLARSATMRETRIANRIFRYCANGSIDNPPVEVSRVIFVVHGNDRRACEIASAALAAGTAEQRATTLVVAPWFPIRGNRVNLKTHLYWTFSSWSQGNESENRDARISSFAVADELLDRVRHHPTVVVGFSGGGQFVNRYAAGTSQEPLRFVITNPSTYLYWTPDRPGTPRSEIAACPAYNNYRYGLKHLNRYMNNAGALNLTRRYGQRHVVYLLGDADNDPRSTSMDKTCGAEAQGRNRFERGQRYWAYLPSVFGPEIHTRHRLQVVPRVSHNGWAMFQHPGAKAALYG